MLFYISKGYMASSEHFSKEKLKDAVELCLENAGQYIKDAESLIESSSFGHASAFAILAYEEIGKAATCMSLIFDCLLTDKDKTTLDISFLWKNHVKKQKITRKFDETYRYCQYLKSYFYQQKRLNRCLNVQEFIKDWKDLAKEKDVEGILKDFSAKRGLEKKKWNGLYIDYKEGKFTSPKMVRKEVAIRDLEDVKSLFESAEKNIRVTVERLSEDQDYQDLVKTFLKLFYRDAI